VVSNWSKRHETAGASAGDGRYDIEKKPCGSNFGKHRTPPGVSRARRLFGRVFCGSRRKKNAGYKMKK